MSGITLALVQLHDTRIPTLTALKTGAEVTQEFLGSYLRNHPLQFPNDGHPPRWSISSDLGLVDNLIDEILYFLGFGFCRGNALMQNQAPQKSFDKGSALIASATENAA